MAELALFVFCDACSATGLVAVPAAHADQPGLSLVEARREKKPTFEKCRKCHGQRFVSVGVSFAELEGLVVERNAYRERYGALAVAPVQPVERAFSPLLRYHEEGSSGHSLLPGPGRDG
jgi:hypothetical protein